MNDFLINNYLIILLILLVINIVLLVSIIFHLKTVIEKLKDVVNPKITNDVYVVVVHKHSNEIKYLDGQAVLCFYDEYYNEYGKWHKILC